MSVHDLDELRRRARDLDRKRDREGPGLAKGTASDARRVWKNRASERLELVVLESGMSTREFAAQLSCSEAALRRATHGGDSGLPLPWWLETLVEKHPDLAARFVRTVLEDIERVRRTGSDRP